MYVKRLRQTLRHIPILGGVYAVVASLGLVALIVGVIGVARRLHH